MNTPNDIVRNIMKELSGIHRKILIDGEEEFQIMCSVPQGSVIGEILWNIFYDGIFTVDMLEWVNTIKYAKDLAILTRAKNV